MRKILLPSLTLLALAGVSPFRGLAAAERDPSYPVSGAAALGYRAYAEEAIEDASRTIKNGWESAQPFSSERLGATLSAQASVGTQSAALQRPLFVATAGGLISADWQGSYLLAGLDIPHNLPGNLLAVGVAVERLDIEDGDGTTAAVEAVLRVSPQWRVPSTRWTAGPALVARVGGSSHGLVVGWDALAHAEYALVPGLALTLDAGVGQRFDDYEVSDVLPAVGGGLSFVF